MGYLRAATTLCCFTIASIITTTLCGCGGGGSLSSPATLEVRGQDFDGQRSVRLHNYNNWGMATNNPEELEGRLEVLARRDNICYAEIVDRRNNTSGWSKISPQSLRSLNPNAKIYRLYDLCVKNTWDSDWSDPNDTRYLQTPLTKAVIDANDWWLRDGDGQIVREHDRTWLLDPGKPGFKEALLQNMLARNAGKGFDGFVFDGHGMNMVQQWVIDVGNNPPSEYPTEHEWFAKAVKPMFEYVAAGLRSSGYRVIVNCVGQFGTDNYMRQWFRSQIDGTIYEQGAVDWWTNGSGWLPGHIIERRINAIANDPLEVWVADGGLRDYVADYDQKQRVSLAMYYVGIPASQEKRSYHHAYDWTPHWQPLWDFHIGVPAEPAVKRSGKYFWSRKFTQGIVLLNYESGDGVTFSLDRTYRTLEGQRVSGDVRLPAHTAMILAVDNAEPSP